MPSLETHQSLETVKMLLLGDTGNGKTGLLATLASAGYRLFVGDFDNGLDVLLDPTVLAPEFRKNVFFKTFYDKATLTAGVLGTTPQAKGFQDFVSSMGNWMEDGKSLGNIYSWGAKDVFVIDSLTFLGNMIMAHVLQLSGRAGQKPQIQDFGSAVDSQESIIETLYNPAVRCNVVVTAHLNPQSDDMQGGVTKMFPSALGKKLPTKIGRYFNTIVQVQKTGIGDKVKRELLTSNSHMTALKVPKPGKVPGVMEPDLNKLFDLLKGN
jgi:hypothetical protein